MPTSAEGTTGMTLQGVADLLQTLPPLTLLNLDVMGQMGDEQMAEAAIKQIPTDRLESLEYSGPWTMGCSDWLKTAHPTLTSLTIFPSPNRDGSSAMEFLPHLSKLVKFKHVVYDGDQIEATAACPALTELDLRYALNLTSATLACLDKNAPNLGRLKTIRMNGCSLLGGQCLAYLERLTGLRTLHCGTFSSGNARGPWVFSKRLANVSHLPLNDLELGPYVAQEVFRYLPRTLTRLRLDLRSNDVYQEEMLSDQRGLGWYLQTQNRPGLTHLILANDRLTDDLLSRILSYAPDLQYLSTDSSQLSAECRAKVAQSRPHLVILQTH